MQYAIRIRNSHTHNVDIEGPHLDLPDFAVLGWYAGDDEPPSAHMRVGVLVFDDLAEAEADRDAVMATWFACTAEVRVRQRGQIKGVIAMDHGRAHREDQRERPRGSGPALS